MQKPTVVSTNSITRAEFLEQQPKNLRDFYAGILNALPPNFTMSAKGIMKKPLRDQKPQRVASAFRVTARVQDSKTKDWSRVIELLDPRGELIDCVIAEGVLIAKPRDAVMKLANKGLQIMSDLDIPIVIDIIRNWPVPRDAHMILVEQVGWVPDRDAFIMTSGRVISRKGVPSKYRFGGNTDGKEIGDLLAWRDGVASIATGNPNIVFGIAIGFSSALMPFTDQNTTIFHFFGRTTKGKTRVLRMALSVWPRVGPKEKTWEGTANGLEGEIAKSHSILMGLDELRADATPDLAAIIYKFANGSSKARGKKEGGSHDRITWNTAVISTGEYSFSDTVKTLGVLPTGGHGVRMLDIPAEGFYGVFDDLHGFDTSDGFVSHLDKLVKKASGSAGGAFVEQLLSLTEEELEEALEADMRTHTLALQQHLGVVAGDDKTAEIRRVITSFALVAIAGEWATKWGLTGWKPGTAAEAVKKVARRWLDNRLRMPIGQAEEIKKMRDYLIANEKHFSSLSDARIVSGDDVRGYQDDTFFYVLPATFSEIGDKNKVLSALTEAGYLERGGEEKSLQFRLPAVVPSRPRAYRIRRTILDFQDKPDVQSDKSEGQE
jgi:putative DNA primase/helicase